MPRSESSNSTSGGGDCARMPSVAAATRMSTAKRKLPKMALMSEVHTANMPSAQYQSLVRSICSCSYALQRIGAEDAIGVSIKHHVSSIKESTREACTVLLHVSHLEVRCASGEM